MGVQYGTSESGTPVAPSIGPMPSEMANRGPVATICTGLARVAGWRSIYTIRTLAAISDDAVPGVAAPIL